MRESLWLLALTMMLLLVAELTEARTTETGRPGSANVKTKSINYEGVPIPIELRLNQEVRVHLDESVEIGLPMALTAKLDVASVHGVVYLTALQSFATQRVALKGSETGRFVLLDVSATSDGTGIEAILIRTDGSMSVPDSERSFTAVQLMRYIARATLAPNRLKAPRSQFKRTMLTISEDRLYRDFAVESSLLAAWRADSLLALAVDLSNQSSDGIALDPSDIGGVWHAAAFQHTRLLPHGKHGASTVMFLVGPYDAIADLTF